GIPMTRQVRATRTAISPRLAIRTFRKSGTPSDDPVRLALLQEGLHSLLRLRGPADLGDALDGVALGALHPPPSPLAAERLPPRARARAALEDLAQARLDGLVEVLLGHGLPAQADLAGAHGLEALAGEEQLARGGLADLRHHVRRDHRGHDAQPHLGE